MAAMALADARDTVMSMGCLRIGAPPPSLSCRPCVSSLMPSGTRLTSRDRMSSLGPMGWLGLIRPASIHAWRRVRLISASFSLPLAGARQVSIARSF